MSTSNEHIVVLNWKDPGHPHAGGAETYTYECLTRLREHARITWVSANAGHQRHRETVNGITHIRLGNRYTHYHHATNWVKNQRSGTITYLIDEINTRGYQTPVWLARRHPRTRLVALAHQTCENVWPYEMAQPGAWAGEHLAEPWWWSAYQHTPVITVSPSSEKAIHSFGVTNTHLGKEGVTVPEGLSTKKNTTPTIVIPGRLTRMKQTEHAIDAWCQATVNNPHLRHGTAYVIGDGPDKQRLEHLYRHNPNVVFTGHVTDTVKWALLARAHIALACGIREGWGLTVTEAAAVNTYPIGYANPGLVDSLNAAHGTAVPNGDTTALARAIADTWNTLSRSNWSGPAHGGAHTWNTVADDFTRLLHTVSIPATDTTITLAERTRALARRVGVRTPTANAGARR